MKMLDHLSARLQSFKILLFIGAVICMPLFAFSVSPSFSLSPLVPLFTMTTCWGLLLVAYWFAPGRGPLSPEILQHKQGLTGFFDRFLRFIAPSFLVVWFLLPLVVGVLRFFQQ